MLNLQNKPNKIIAFVIIVFKKSQHCKINK